VKVVMGNFITASQAQSKWFTKVISKVSSGNYRLRVVRFFSLYLKVTGWLEGEKMQVYVRLGIRLLLKVQILIPPLLVTYQIFLQGAKDQTEGT
jgi:phosphatidylserine decarboxylase